MHYTINFPREGKHDCGLSVRFLGTVIIKRIKVSTVEQQAQSKRTRHNNLHYLSPVITQSTQLQRYNQDIQ